MPLITRVESVSIRQQTAEDQSECYSSDLQQISTDLRVLYRVPEDAVVQIFKEFAGDPFDSLIAPRAQEALLGRRRQREARAGVTENERVDPIQNWYGWEEYLGNRQPVVVINVMPRAGETRSSGWLASSASA